MKNKLIVGVYRKLYHGVMCFLGYHIAPDNIEGTYVLYYKCVKCNKIEMRY